MSDIGRHPDEALLDMAKGGDTHAFEELFNRHKKPILNFIYRMVGSRETAEEITIEVFMNVYKNLGLYDPAKKFLPWVYTIARNLAKNALRDRKYYRDVSLDQDIGDGEGGESKTMLRDLMEDHTMRPDLILEHEELELRVQAVLDSMRPEYREAITLCSIQGMTYEEASKIVGISIAGLAKRLEKAKEEFLRALRIEIG